MTAFRNLPALLRRAAGNGRSIRFISGDKDETVVSTADLWRRASALLADLQRRGMRPGDELVIFTKSNESFTVAFWAGALGGIVPVPVAVGISDEHRLKLIRILRQLRRARLFTEPDLCARLAGFAHERSMPDIKDKLDQAVLADSVADGGEGELHSPADDDLAFVQYSSGSTGDPKGVCLTHRNLAVNIRAIVEGTGWSERDTSLSWMPLTHDMGLVGFHLSVLAAGMDHAVMDTDLFVRRPLLWLSKATELRATQLCSPNFGYKHFLKLFERKGLDNLDLSAVQLILNGAEPISRELCEAFLDALAPYGLKRSAMFPVYGLAEATVAVTLPEPGRDYGYIVADRHGLCIGEPYRPADPGHADALSFVKVGKAVRDCRIRIAGDADEPLVDGIVGHIQVSGSNVTSGIYGDPDAEAALFTGDGWLRTGDVGLIADGELVITGRSKDIVIVNGQNYYPHDLEEILAKVDGLDLGKVVVAGSCRGTSQAEELLVFLLHRRDLDEFRPLVEAVRATLGTQVGLAVDRVVPVMRIPKTTSGKVQRAHLAAAYANGEFDEVLAALETAERVPRGDEDGDPLVAELLAICRKFAQDRPIGPDDNLFEVGVSSLTLTEIVLAIDEKHPGRLDISDLFDHPTVRHIAAFLRR